MLNINPKNYQSENILSHEEVLKVIKRLREKGKKIGLASGCFDLLHPGHITYLEEAKKTCDVLIVAVARDNYLKKTRSFGRPIFSEQLRAFMISKLKPVDYVIFEEAVSDINDLVFDIMDFIKPDFYIKGKDKNHENEPILNYHKKLIESFGGRMVFTKTEKLSSTEIINYIKKEV